MLTHRRVLRQLAAASGAHPAICSPGRRITFGDLNRSTDALAGALLGWGLVPGDRVLWMSRNAPEFFIAYFATAKAGLAFVPVNHWLRSEERAALVDAVAPSAVIASADLADAVDEACDAAGIRPRARVSVGAGPTGWLTWDAALAAPGGGPFPDDERAVHEIVFTSGTTGPPKGVTRSQRKRILDAYRSALAFRLSAKDHMLLMSPQHHIGGAATPCQVLLQGGTVSVADFAPDAVADAIADGVTFLAGVPTHYLLLFESGELDRVDTRRVLGCKTGGSATPPTVFDAIHDHFPNAEQCCGYGMTESGPHTLALRGMDPADPRLLGRAVPGNEVCVVDAGGQEQASGEVGEIRLRSDVLFDGYLGRPEMTAAAFTDGWYRTGDLAWRDDEGRFFFAGRAKDLIITGGVNVYPVEVEGAMASLTEVAEVAVLGMPDDLFVERVVAVVRLRPEASSATPDQLARSLRSRIAGFKCPKEIYLSDDLPRTGSGKVARDVLQRQVLSGNLAGGPC